MKITHNKVGQNLNSVDGAKSEKSGRAGVAQKKSADAGSVLPANIKDSAKVEVSPRAQEAARIKELAMSAPEVDQAKVEKFRKLIDEGKYSVNSKAVADKMVDEHLETSN